MEPWDGAGGSNIPPPASPVVYAAPAPPSGFRHRFSREDDDELARGWEVRSSSNRAKYNYGYKKGLRGTEIPRNPLIKSSGGGDGS